MHGSTAKLTSFFAFSVEEMEDMFGLAEFYYGILNDLECNHRSIF